MNIPKTLLLITPFLFATSIFAKSITPLGTSAVDWTGNVAFSKSVDFVPQGKEKTSLPFFGNNVFSLTDQFLINNQQTGIKMKNPFAVEIEGNDGVKEILLSTRDFNKPLKMYVKNWTPPSVKIRNADALNEGGKTLIIEEIINSKYSLSVTLSLSIRDKSNYFIQEATIKNIGDKPVKITKIRLGDYIVPDISKVKTIGNVPGSPVALSKNILAAIEQPSFKLEKADKFVSLCLPVSLTLQPKSDALHFSSMIGYFPEDQQRRSFNYYLERERATPSKHFLHYNGWYDFGLSPNEIEVEKAFDAYGTELTKKRAIDLDAVVLDDGWDYPVKDFAWEPLKTKFPNGFTKLAEKAESYNSHFGIWISPLGGYFDTNKRIAAVKKQGGLPEDAKAFDLAYPEYKKWFFEKCHSLITKDRVRYFKWDKAGEGVSMHFMNLLDVAKKLRVVAPSLYINVTVGTWPSPFWLNHIDCTWRDGADVAFWFKDIGNERDQWLSYRDGELYNRVVRRAPLYPINSIMHHGIVLGKHYQGKDCAKAGNDMTREIRSYFALGPNLQEIYVNYTMVGDEFWNDLAEAVRWSQRNALALVDTHWVKGVPNNNNKPGIYSLAGWHRNSGVIYIRNASNKSDVISFSLDEAFELPNFEKGKTYHLKNAYNTKSAKYDMKIKSNEVINFKLEPLEVLILDAECIK